MAIAVRFIAKATSMIHRKALKILDFLIYSFPKTPGNSTKQFLRHLSELRKSISLIPILEQLAFLLESVFGGVYPNRDRGWIGLAKVCLAGDKRPDRSIVLPG